MVVVLGFVRIVPAELWTFALIYRMLFPGGFCSSAPGPPAWANFRVYGYTGCVRSTCMCICICTENSIRPFAGRICCPIFLTQKPGPTLPQRTLHPLSLGICFLGRMQIHGVLTSAAVSQLIHHFLGSTRALGQPSLQLSRNDRHMYIDTYIDGEYYIYLSIYISRL